MKLVTFTHNNYSRVGAVLMMVWSIAKVTLNIPAAYDRFFGAGEAH